MDIATQLRSAAIPLAGADPALPEDDLAPLLDRLAGARLVGLGEATHGDHESFAFKCRLIQALVRRGQCDVVIFERGVAEMETNDHYVAGQTSALTLGEDLYPWRTEEVRDLFTWLRDWNAAGGQVHVAGMDMQSPAGLPLALSLLDDVGIAAPDAWRRLATEADGRGREAIWLEEAMATWQATEPPHCASSELDQRWITLLAGTFQQWLEIQSCRVKGGWVECGRWRDRCMAENVLAQLDRFDPVTKAVIWAHNSYVSRAPSVVGGDLHARMGTGYRSVGFAFGRGTFNAGSGTVNAATKVPEGPLDWTLRPHPAESSPAGSLEYALDQLDLDCYAVAPADVAALRQEVPARLVEAAVVENLGQFWWHRCVPADVFDLLVYFRAVQPSRLL